MPRAKQVNHTQQEMYVDKRGPFPLVVNWARPIEDLVSEGHYDDVTRNMLRAGLEVPEIGFDRIEGDLVSFTRRSSTDDILRALDRVDMRPAKFRELLVFGIKHPDIQREFAIVALGSISRFRGKDCLAYLHGDRYGRTLVLGVAGDGWRVKRYQFLAFPKE